MSLKRAVDARCSPDPLQHFNRCLLILVPTFDAASDTMADKEATVFILDLGSTMAQSHNGRTESDLDWSMQFVWDKIGDIVAANRKTLHVGVVGLRTDETSNKLDSEDGYENISVLKEMGTMTMSSLKDLQGKIKPSSTWTGDAISAIVVSVDMIETLTKKLKYIRKIYLITDGQGAIDAEDIEEIAKKMNGSNISLTVLYVLWLLSLIPLTRSRGVDFDDPEYGTKEEDKSPTKVFRAENIIAQGLTVIQAENEKTLRGLVDACSEGTFASMAEAIDRLDVPTVKSVKPYKCYDGELTLGDPKKDPTSMVINVERYFKTHVARPQGASTVVVKNESGPTQSTETVQGDEMEGVEFSGVKQARTYKVNDPDAPGGKKDVEFESLAKGYEYGRTAVPISESEHNITKLESTKSFTIIGFIPWDKVGLQPSHMDFADVLSTSPSSIWGRSALLTPNALMRSQN